MEQRRNEMAGENCRSPTKSANQRHHQARFPHAKIRERIRRESNLVRLGSKYWGHGAEWLHHSPSTKTIRVQSPAGSPDFRMWESCWTMPLVGGFSRGWSRFPRPLIPVLSILPPIIGSQDLTVKSRPISSLTH
ncbi:hypothetical protein PR048_027111 [Dryococelus australis]|uniref:Uncharacterized protein n=1 Tax=Dryococelus australis TaxID=614101 RepID=A0ABQ9GF19_9NEOP|nr:hypothetical protein PR048_027111 [Dryococelus australis]